MDMDTFMTLVKESSYPPLSNEDEAALQEDIANVVNSYFGDEAISEDRKAEIATTIEMVAKFVALHVSRCISTIVFGVHTTS